MLIQYYIHTHNIYIFAIPSGKLTGCELERSTIFNGQIQYKPSPTQQTHDDGEEINIYIYDVILLWFWWRTWLLLGSAWTSFWHKKWHDMVSWLWINTYENTIFSGMNIHFNPAILMWTEGVLGFDPLPYDVGMKHNHIPVGKPSSYPKRNWGPIHMEMNQSWNPMGPLVLGWMFSIGHPINLMIGVPIFHL